MHIYKSSNNIGTIRKNQEILKFFPCPLKPKTICMQEVKILLYLLRYVPDQYKIQ